MVKTWILRGGAVLLVLALVAAAYAYYQMRSRGFWRIPVYETEAPVLPELKQPAILVFSKTNSFIHREAIPAAETLFREMADRNGWSIYVTENGAVHNLQDLKRFQAVIWNNVTGNVLTEDQREALKQYLQEGGGWLGLHGAGDDSRDWPWFRNTLIGATFIGHPMEPQFQQASVVVERPNDSIMSHLPSVWQRTDEWYSFDKSPRDSGVTVLATLDETTYSPRFFKRDIRMGGDHPIIWKRCIGKGRSVYSAMGHTAESFSESLHVQLLENAVNWLSGASLLETSASDCVESLEASQ